MKFHRAIEYNLKKTLDELNHKDIKGIELILNEIDGLKESMIYEKMYNGSVLGKKIFSSDAQLIETEKNQSNHLMAIGFKNLGKFPFHVPQFSSLISFANLNALYSLLVLAYYAHANKELGCEDFRNIYLSGLDHKVIQTLDKFDETLNVPKTDKEYLIALKNLRWKNSDTTKLLKKLNYVKSLIGQNRFRLTYQIGIQRAEDKFMLFIAGCSAVNNERNEISEDDVIKAYQTYFKLINTDITKYKAIDKSYEPEITGKVNNDYLVCEKCNGYYKLQPSESSENFDRCQCGGKLIYYENINEFENAESNTENINRNG
ncbi:MAG: hypothetical protein KKF16_00040 [Euryarchaeota archaeon]|nr:hypothetical protein [Euryarchaeota archaeon]MBU4607803.1 hypothetical protein [Euryarchaeota archaeon]MBV1755160.1 hypothetical protein [Methanobacterium sp.]